GDGVPCDDAATALIYTLSLHDALPILAVQSNGVAPELTERGGGDLDDVRAAHGQRDAARGGQPQSSPRIAEVTDVQHRARVAAEHGGERGCTRPRRPHRLPARRADEGV